MGSAEIFAARVNHANRIARMRTASVEHVTAEDPRMT